MLDSFKAFVDVYECEADHGRLRVGSYMVLVGFFSRENYSDVNMYYWTCLRYSWTSTGGKLITVRQGASR